MRKFKKWELELVHRFIDGDDILVLVLAYSKQLKHKGETRPMCIRKRMVENLIREWANK